MIKKADAIRSINPNIILSQNGDEFTIHNDEKMPSDEAIQAKLKELKADYDAKQYQRDRAIAYDPIPEQLDQIYHDIDGWKAKIKAVKDKYTKPT